MRGGYLLYGRNDAMAWIGAMDREFSRVNPTENRHDKVIADLYKEGVPWYNLGGCEGLTGVSSFKKKIGAVPIPYHVLYWRSRPLSGLARFMKLLRG